MATDAGGTLTWLLAGVVLVAATVTALVRVVPAHERAVVVRLGRVARLRGPGVVAVVPGVERVVRVSLRDSRLETACTRATTRDGVTVWVQTRALFRVVDPVRSYLAASDLRTRTAEAVEAAVRREVARSDLPNLVTQSTERAERVLYDANEVVARWGAEICDVELVDIDLPLTSELMRWAEHLAQTPDKVHGARAG